MLSKLLASLKAALLPAESTSGYVATPTRIMQAIVNQPTLSGWLPYSAYLEDERIFVNHDSLGFCLELQPQSGADEEMAQILMPLFTGSRAGTGIQLHLLGGAHIRGRLRRYANLRVLDAENARDPRFGRAERNHNIYRAMARQRVAYYLRGARQALLPGYLLRNIRLVLSVTVPGNVEDLSLLEELTLLREGMRTTLRAAGFPNREWDAADLINWVSDLLNPQRTFGDPHRMRQVMTNLLANSTKFTNQGGVHLRASLVGQSNGIATVRFEVIDTGVGMSPEAVSQIFQPFVQADQSTTRQFGGTGLGTTIARQLTELMKGRMGAESAPDEGSTFWFEVPFHTQRPGFESSFDGVRVLLVGLDRTREQELAGLLRAWHLEVATSGMEVAPMILAADQAGKPWHVVLISLLGQDIPIVDLEAALSSGRRRPQVIALGSPQPAADRAAMIRWPYVAILSPPVTKERLHRALNFAALDELDAHEYAAQWERHHAIGTAGDRPRVLVAEDNATNRKIIAQILEYGGFDVTLAATGTQAVEALQQANFDIVILDKHMPGMSGMEVATRYKEFRDGNAAPMIMLTAEATAEAMQECKEAGMQAFLTKPIDPDMLFETISALTGTGSLRTTDPERASSAANKLEPPVTDGPLLDEAVLSELDKHAYSPQFVVEVVDSFESDMLDLIERLDATVKSEDWPEVAEIRHAIEGTARGSGAAAIAGLIGDLKTLHAAEPGERDARIARLRTCFAGTREAMREFLSKRATALPRVKNRAEPVIPSP